MKKKFTHIISLLGIITAGTGYISAQNENSLSAELEVASDFSAPINNPINPAKQSYGVSVFSLLYDNGPLVNGAGQGSGGADVSALHDGLVLYGLGHSITAGYRVADDFTVPVGETWTIDSIIFYSYQTNSTTASTFTDVHLAVRNSSPLVNPNPSTIVWGDTVTNVLNTTYWSGIYRTNATFSSTARPIMKNVVSPGALQLVTGTYWFDWSSSGDASLSGPWVPPITFSSQTITGDAVQFNGATFAWASIIDTAQAGPSDNAAQGLPFTIYGSINSGVDELYPTNSVKIYPNPMNSTAYVIISDHVQKSSSDFSFLIYDLSGKIVKQTEAIKTNTFAIYKEDVSTGIYIYEVRNGSQIIMRGKLSIQAE